jgi:hypothetical protein
MKNNKKQKQSKTITSLRKDRSSRVSFCEYCPGIPKEEWPGYDWWVR